ncbi:MAG TPA: cyclopropane-fatty-acyl-phospholipid synthase family protein [Bryobacteraceae bacterium]|nr:cyclopropane-fatty-acyl-phospholipid synthase family protein [Bryobacteraceae bacterium]
MQATEARPNRAATVGYAVEYRSGQKELCGEGPPAFTILVPDRQTLEHVLKDNSYAVALSYIHGEFDISGDLVAALQVRHHHSRRGFLDFFWSLAARFAPRRIETWFQSRERAARNIRFHYDASNDFYGTFLDSNFVYSAGYFDHANWSLEEAQQAKLEGICKRLDLHPGERFLDVGCGWGGLLLHAVEHYSVHGVGCTLSRSQYTFTESTIHIRGLDHSATVKEIDYRDLTGRFDKIASIGMFEHVGRRRLSKYFAKIYSLLESGGLFFNSGVTRPQSVTGDAQTCFLQRRVFPGGELAHLSDVIRKAEGAGLTVLNVQSLRKHYARTCREWVERLRQRKEACVGLVGDETYRTWLLYLSASALSFETGQTDVFSILMTRR